MNPDDLDRALREPLIAPSDGFVRSVMDAVRREAATPAPIGFPWSRALPGFIATALAVAASIVLLFAGGLSHA